MPSVQVNSHGSGLAVSPVGIGSMWRWDYVDSDPHSYLLGLAQSVLPSCSFVVSSGEFSGTTLWMPGGDGYYGPNMVIRDQAMMMRGAPHLFTAQQMAGVVDVIASCANRGHGDHIVEGMSQGGTYHDYGWFSAGSGKIVVDESFEFIDTVYTHFKKTGSASKYSQHEATILAALNAQAVDDHCVYLSNAESDRVGFGFVDSITIRGYHLYCSLQRIRSMRQIVEMLGALSRTQDADGTTVSSYNAEIAASRDAIVSTLWNPSRGLFKFGTLANTAQHDVPGSALFVVLFQDDQSVSGVCEAVSDALFNMLPGGTNATNGCFLSGQVRNFPLDDPYFTVFRTGIPQGAYQNGGYWGTHTAHAATAIDFAHPSHGMTLLNAWVNKCKQVGATAPAEAEGGSWSYSYLYGANAALPLLYWDSTARR